MEPDDHTASMTQTEREALPWYGGNKIPDSYLQRFMRPTDPETASMPYEVRQFLEYV